MNFEIYFDESNKLDKKLGLYAYYGVIGWSQGERKLFEEFAIENKIFQELHFAEFNLDKVDKYIKTLEYALPKINSNFYIVNKNESFQVAQKINISDGELRKLFYLKIPERLIYGMTRKMPHYKEVNIYIDKSDEYGNDCSELDGEVDQNEHIQLPYTLKSQLNAQSIYRNLNYSINSVKQIDSHQSKSLQVIDVLLGIIKFLYEEEYLYLNPQIEKYIFEDILNENRLTKDEKDTLIKTYKLIKYRKNNIERYEVQEDISEDEIKSIKNIATKIEIYSNRTIQKAEFVYQLLQDSDMFEYISNFSLFLWEDERLVVNDSHIRNFKEVAKKDLSKYIAKFLKFKTDYDNKSRLKIQKYQYENYINIRENPLTESEYRNLLNYNGSLKRLIRRYLLELNIETRKQ